MDVELVVTVEVAEVVLAVLVVLVVVAVLGLVRTRLRLSFDMRARTCSAKAACTFNTKRQ